jgi:magnesium-transporting ATPase (P-type)
LQERKFILSKGADSKIFSKLAPDSDRIVDVTSKFLSAWGEDGLRTLCFAYRSIPEEEFEAWFERYNSALRNDAEKAKFDRKVFPNAIDDAMNMVEQGLVLQVR